MSGIDHGELLTPEQVANELQMSLWYVYQILKRGRLAARREGKVWRVLREDFELYKRRPHWSPIKVQPSRARGPRLARVV
jgi:putative molybdopterin biosynthesis protein